MGEAAPPAARPASGVPSPAPPTLRASRARRVHGDVSGVASAHGEAAPPAQDPHRAFRRRPPPTPPAPAGTGEFHTVFSVSALAGTGAGAGAWTGFPSAAAPPKPVGSVPGEFTRIFGKGDLPAAQAGPARPEFTPRATPAPSAGPGNIPDVLGSAGAATTATGAGLGQTPHQRAAPARPRKCPGSCWRSSWRGGAAGGGRHHGLRSEKVRCKSTAWDESGKLDELREFLRSAGL